MLIAVTLMAASHALASLDIQEMERCVKVNITYLLWQEILLRAMLQTIIYMYTLWIEVLFFQILMNVLLVLIPVI